MRKFFLFFICFFTALCTYGQDSGFHYIKFLHVGEQIMPVHPLNIYSGDDQVPRDSAELLTDTLKAISIKTDGKSYKALSVYIYGANFRIRRANTGKIEFGTFKIIEDGKRFYLPDFSVTNYFIKMVKYLKAKKADPLMIRAIVDNYPWIFNP